MQRWFPRYVQTTAIWLDSSSLSIKQETVARQNVICKILNELEKYYLFQPTPLVALDQEICARKEHVRRLLEIKERTKTLPTIIRDQSVPIRWNSQIKDGGNFLEQVGEIVKKAEWELDTKVKGQLQRNRETLLHQSLRRYLFYPF